MSYCFRLSFLLLVAGSLFAQGTGNIHGTVRDVSGAPIPHAKVKATLIERGLTRSGESEADGSFVLPSLPVGDYTVEVAIEGFKTFQQKGITLTANQNARVDAILEVGVLSQSVAVTAEAPLVDSRSSSVGTLIDSRRVTELPINGRNIISLSALLPGATQVNAPQTFTGDRSGPTVSISGSRGNENSFLFDGAQFNANFRNTGLNYPPPDALQEVKVLTNTFSAEYGRNAGSIFNVVTKSGTNQIHGSAWEFLRNQALNARNFFAPSVKPQLIQNQFGATAGGPVLKDRLFIFGSYEGLRIRPASLATSAFPLTAAERQGDFSASKTAVRDPLTGQPFPNNQIPTNRFDPVAAKILSTGMMPLPNQPDGQYVTTFPTPQNNDNYLTRVDYNRGRHTIDGHYNYNAAVQNSFGGQIPSYLPLSNEGRSHNVAAGDTFAIRPSLLNEARFGYTRFRASIANQSGVSLADLGSNFPAIGPKIPPALAISGRVTLGNNSSIDSFQLNEAFQFTDHVTWNRDRHTIKMGFDLLKSRYGTSSYFESMGDFAFGGGISGNPAADFLLGRAESLVVASPAFVINERQTATYYFIQDDWKVSPHLTLNIGLRYELPLPWVDSKGYGVTFREGQKSTVVPNAPVGMVFPGDAGIPKGLVPTDRNNFAPRVGFAWSPASNNRTVIRGAYGIFYETINADIFQWSSSQPFRYTFTINSPFSLTDPLRGQPALPLEVDLQKPQFTGVQQLFYPDPNLRAPYVQQFNVNVQREVVKDFVIQAGYVGKLGRKLLIGMSANPAIYQPGATLANINQRRIIQPFGANNVISSRATSEYNALQIEGTKRLSHGFSMQGSYTFSRSLDMASAISLGASIPNVLDLHTQWGRSDFDAKHIGSVSWLWQLPETQVHSGILRAAVNGWQVNGLLYARSGFPVNIVSGSDRALSGTNNQRPDVVGSAALPSDRPKADKVLQWFNPAAFALPALGAYGNAGRNVVDGPGAINTNVALFKNFRIPFRERTQLQFRSEFFNVLNHANFGAPGNSLGARLGRITTADDGRVIQFALKLLF